MSLLPSHCCRRLLFRRVSLLSTRSRSPRPHYIVPTAVPPQGYHRRFTYPSLKTMGDNRAVNMLEDFEVVMEGQANDIHPVTKYRSKSTGLEVVYAQIEGPVVNCYVVVATRAEDNDGLPHTLEHLVFMGSEEYPYKGVLDILANKCFASGTNAWTDVDHTAYTLTTAGSEGFCNMISIYMDHIFHPILSDSAFVTEVYHTTGEGTDAGVVYCELQATENTAEERMYNEVVTTIYPPSSGYHYQTGGKCKNLRESCDNAKVKEFHKKFYNPRNCCLIVAGMVKPEDLFAALEPTITKLNAKKAVPNSWVKPWLDDVEEIKEAVTKTIKFPAEDSDDEAMVTVAFRGPSAIRDIETVSALRLLFEYLTDSSVGPLQLAFVENDDPICSGVSYAEMENSRTTFYIEFEAVVREKMPSILPTLKSTLEMLEKKTFDFSRMTDVIKKNVQEEFSAMENSPHKTIAYAVIGDFLYGSDDKGMFSKRINAVKTISGFLDKPREYWTGLIRSAILDQKWVTICAEPSKETAVAIAKEEEGRVLERRMKLGEPGLAKLAHELEEAIKDNSMPTPPNVLESIPVPCASSIHFHSIARHANPDWTNELKCNFYLDDIKSNFVYVSVHMDTTELSYEQRKWLPLFREVLVESPVVMDDGKVMSFEEVVADLNRTWLSYGCSMGIDGGGRFKCGSYNHQFALNCQMELDKLEPGFDWLRKLLWKTQWNRERTRTVAKKMAGDIPQMKRKGNRTAYAVLKDILYKGESNVKTSSLFRQQKFLKDVNSLSEKKLAEAFDSIREVLLRPGNVTIHMACSLDKLNAKAQGTSAGTLSALLNKTFTFAPDAVGVKRLPNEADVKWMKNVEDFKSSPELRIMGNRTEDASYMVKVSPGPTSYMDPELPILLTAMQYLCQTEGPFYRGIRGAGLAYDFFMDARCNEGLIYFNLYRCTDVVAAFKSAMDIVNEHLNPESKDVWLEEYLSSAKSSLIFEYIEGEKTPLALSSTSLCSYYRDVPEGYTRQIISKITEVKLCDLAPLVAKYIRPMFMEDHICSIVTPQDKVVSVVEGFERVHSKKLVPITSTANSFLEKWEQ